MLNKESQGETEVDSEQMPIATTSSPNAAKPNVVRSAYYTPSIYEFQVGFEFEVNDKGKWAKYLFLPFDEIHRLSKDKRYSILAYANIDEIKNDIDKGILRVKELDKKDLIDLGFRIFGKGDKTFLIKTNTTYVVHLLGSKTVVTKDIKLPDKSEATTTVFDGVIKNKSELKRILQQTGCVQS